MEPRSLAQSFWLSFLGTSPDWYKYTIIAFLLINPILLFSGVNVMVVGWLLVLQFIFTLAMALTCYPLLPGGLLAVEAIILGLTSPEAVYGEIEQNLEVILLLMFMVAGIYFMKDLLLFIFSKLLILIRSKLLLSFLFSAVAAFLSAFLDALTVMAVIIAVILGFYAIYNTVKAGLADIPEDVYDIPELADEHQAELDELRAFLRNLVMHGAVGTALGGVMTLVGEPQNLLIANRLDWEFLQFVVEMAPVTVPVLIVGLTTCLLLEITKICGYGAKLPQAVFEIIQTAHQREMDEMTHSYRSALIVQALAAIILIVALASHVAEVGLIGLLIIVLQTAFNGETEEHNIGKAFQEALPFTALLVVFFAIVAVIHGAHLFAPISDWVLGLPTESQPGFYYIANGLLSAISDNVFVATVYIQDVADAYAAGEITRQQFDLLGIAINTGTNIPSILTPNGQAAFLFLLTSSLAPLIRLSYGRMVLMAIPYFVTMGTTGWICVNWFLI
ncbi:MAG: sodium/proton antiporter NhaB [Gammaproteobacteria bacterium]|nr:sodium/proton antiporter NhaB [Gammaproteobacteria bacterium]